MSKELKDLLKSEFARRFEGVDGCVLIDYHGLDSEQTQNLRSQLRASGVRMSVIQNRLAQRVFADMETPESFRELLRGPVAILVGEDGAVTASKKVVEWSKKNDDLAAVKGGLLDGETLSAEKVQALAKLPSLDELRASVAGSFLSPMTHIASCTQALLSHFASCAKAHHEAQGEGE